MKTVTKKYFEPHNAGINSSDRGAARRLSRLLSSMGNEINNYIGSGELCEDLFNLRISIHEKLKKEGWRISGTKNGWKVLPPKY